MRRDSCAHCNTLHHTAPHCTTYPNYLMTHAVCDTAHVHTATHCNPLQHTAPDCTRLHHLPRLLVDTWCTRHDSFEQVVGWYTTAKSSDAGKDEVGEDDVALHAFFEVPKPHTLNPEHQPRNLKP